MNPKTYQPADKLTRRTNGPASHKLTNWPGHQETRGIRIMSAASLKVRLSPSAEFLFRVGLCLWYCCCYSIQFLFGSDEAQFPTKCYWPLMWWDNNNSNVLSLSFSLSLPLCLRLCFSVSPSLCLSFSVWGISSSLRRHGKDILITGD